MWMKAVEADMHVETKKKKKILYAIGMIFPYECVRNFHWDYGRYAGPWPSKRTL